MVGCLFVFDLGRCIFISWFIKFISINFFHQKNEMKWNLSAISKTESLPKYKNLEERLSLINGWMDWRFVFKFVFCFGYKFDKYFDLFGDLTNFNLNRVILLQLYIPTHALSENLLWWLYFQIYNTWTIIMEKQSTHNTHTSWTKVPPYWLPFSVRHVYIWIWSLMNSERKNEWKNFCR